MIIIRNENGKRIFDSAVVKENLNKSKMPFSYKYCKKGDYP